MSKQTSVSKPIAKSQGPTAITNQTAPNPKGAIRKVPSTSIPPKQPPKNPTVVPPKITVVKEDVPSQQSKKMSGSVSFNSIEEARKRLEEEQKRLQKEREEFEREKKRFEEEKIRLSRSKPQSQESVSSPSFVPVSSVTTASETLFAGASTSCPLLVINNVNRLKNPFTHA